MNCLLGNGFLHPADAPAVNDSAGCEADLLGSLRSVRSIGGEFAFGPWEWRACAGRGTPCCPARSEKFAER